MERATGTEVYDGCGSTPSSDITLNIQTTTGRSFTVSLCPSQSVEHLKKVVSKKLRVSKDRICLLHRERQLRDGTLEENGLLDGARVILLPSVETGLLSQRTENSVMQALESLNDTQVNDFLSGKSPLNLTMRLGDHMMLIQLQLSTLNSGSSSGSRSLRTPATASTSRAKTDARDTPSPQDSPQKSDKSTNASDKTEKPKKAHFLQQKELEMLQSAFDLYRTMAEEKLINDEKEDPDSSNSFSDMSDDSENDQSPIKSLSNLVSSPITPSTSERDADIVNTVKSNLLELLTNNKLSTDAIPSTSAMSEEPPPGFLTPDSSLSDDSDNYADQSSFLAESTIDEYPMENLFNSAVDKGLFEEQDESMMDREISNLATTSHGQEAPAGTLPSFQSINEPLKNKRFQCLLHKTSKFKHPIGQNKQKAFMQSVVNKHKKRMQIRQESNLAQPSTSRTEPYIMNTRKLILQPSPSTTEETEEQAIPSTSKNTDNLAVPSTSKQNVFKVPDVPKKHTKSQEPPPVDTRALIEASKNLTQKLKKLSKEVLKNKIKIRSAEETLRSKISRGAVIESMKHHGKGIYSGTFSGTLNPALQDRYGRPKRDISTIIHILNDLLCAAPPVALSQKDTKNSSIREETTKCKNCEGATLQCSCKGECTCIRPVTFCKQCDTAKTLALDNSKTKCKLDQLRLVMQQKKQRREARKLKTLPYTSPPKKEQSPPLPEEIETVA